LAGKQLKNNYSMKHTKNFLFGILAVTAMMFFTACEENNVQPTNDYGILPERFKVDIPNSISNEFKSGSLKSTEGDTINGNEIYAHLANFIAIGEGSAEIVESIIWAIKVYNIDNIIDLTYTSDDDYRVKHLAVVSDVDFQEQTWEYQLTITDVESEGAEDGGIGMQVFWNNSPIEGIALIKPYNLNREEDADAGDAMFKVKYSEVGMGDYDAYMIVEIADLPLPDANWDAFAVNNLKMFVGKKGNMVDVYGNSNHPNAQFFTDKTGFNWAFVASGLDSEDIGVAEVGLPPSILDTSSREIILKDYSVKNVLTEEINQWFLDAFGIRPHEEDLANYLKNADAPGYFNTGGFVQGGDSPGSEYDEIEARLESLSPYNPKEINDLVISFK
jgi:hypothetical protein